MHGHVDRALTHVRLSLPCAHQRFQPLEFRRSLLRPIRFPATQPHRRGQHQRCTNRHELCFHNGSFVFGFLLFDRISPIQRTSRRVQDRNSRYYSEDNWRRIQSGGDRRCANNVLPTSRRQSFLGCCRHFAGYWDHEPVDCAVASWTAPVLWRFWLARLHRQSASRRRAEATLWRAAKAERLSSLPKKTPAGHALSILSICLIFSVSTVADARLVYPQSPQPGSLPACWAVLDV